MFFELISPVAMFLDIFYLRNGLGSLIISDRMVRLGVHFRDFAEVCTKPGAAVVSVGVPTSRTAGEQPARASSRNTVAVKQPAASMDQPNRVQREPKQDLGEGPGSFCVRRDTKPLRSATP